MESKAAFTIVAGMVFLCGIVRADDRERLAEEAKACKERGVQVREQAASIEHNLQWLSEFAAVDMKGFRAAWDAEGEAWTRAAAAYQAGDEARAKSLHAAADAARRISELWQRRLDVRSQQRNVAPEEGWYDGTCQWTAKAARPKLDALCRAKRAASDAWGDLAEALTPGADPQALTQLTERALHLNGEAEIANWDFDSTNTRESILQQDPRIASPQLQQILDRLRQLDQERFGLKRQELDRQRRDREVDAEREREEKHLREVFEKLVKEKRAREEAQRNGGKNR